MSVSLEYSNLIKVNEDGGGGRNFIMVYLKKL